MADPQHSYPESATNGARKKRVNGEGTAAVEAAVSTHGETIAAAIERSDELEDALETTILVLASLDDDEVAALTNAASNLVAAGDGLTTDEAAELAGEVGTHAGSLSNTLEVVVELEEQGMLDDVLELQREGDLDELMATAQTLSALDIDDDAVAGLNVVLGAVGEASRGSKPVGPLGLLRGLTTRNAKAGLGFALTVLKSLGRRLRE